MSAPNRNKNYIRIENKPNIRWNVRWISLCYASRSLDDDSNVFPGNCNLRCRLSFVAYIFLLNIHFCLGFYIFILVLNFKFGGYSCFFSHILFRMCFFLFLTRRGCSFYWSFLKYFVFFFLNFEFCTNTTHTARPKQWYSKWNSELEKNLY